jgi:hypothetical protein
MNQVDQKFLHLRDDRRNVRLEDWLPFPYKRNKILVGYVFGHPRLRDGRLIRTSPVLFMTDSFAQTFNTMYELGKKGHWDMPFDLSRR